MIIANEMGKIEVELEVKMPLNKQEKEIIWKVFRTLRSTSSQISDCQDLWLSDVRNIEAAFWLCIMNLILLKKELRKKEND